MIYWVVQYRMWGADGPSYEYFRTYDAAHAFHLETDYSDPPERIYIDKRDWLKVQQIESVVNES